jgi:hypothetical protein
MDSTKPKPFVFVLMPFDSKFGDIYELGIKAACVGAGGYCERVDEQIFENSILDRIYNQISKADLIVADMTDRNPNVFYEVGYAHALGKRVILLTQNAKDIPFDLVHYPHIVYEGKITQLKPNLEKRVRWAFENLIEVQGSPERHIDLYVFGYNILENSMLTTPLEPGRINQLRFDLEMNNSTEKLIQPLTFQIGMICNPDVNFNANLGQKGVLSYKTINLKAQNKNLHIVENYFELLPGCWEKLNFFLFKSKAYEFNQQEDIIIRIFSSAGTVDYPLKFSFAPNTVKIV